MGFDASLFLFLILESEPYRRRDIFAKDWALTAWGSSPPLSVFAVVALLEVQSLGKGKVRGFESHLRLRKQGVERWVSGVGYRLSGIEYQVSSIEYRVSGIGQTHRSAPTPFPVCAGGSTVEQDSYKIKVGSSILSSRMGVGV